MVNELKRRVDVPESSHAAKVARCDDADQRGWGLEREHTIFLSHSGEQKNFTEWLFVELKRAHYFPFFDKSPDSLPKGHDSHSAIIQAARQCHVAILVLSEDFFTRSRWPMIELNEFVKAQASTNSTLKLLPLFYKISVAEFKALERQRRWQAIWQGWAAEDIRTTRTHKPDVDVGAWASALSVVGRSNGLEYIEKVGEVTYVAKVVKAVRKLVLPCVKYDVSHVQSLQWLCEPIFAKFHDLKGDHPLYKVQVVGLFGMGGVGKTTITKAMCNGPFGDFVGDFCHVELGTKDVGVLRRQVLQDLMGEASLPNDLDKLKMLLNKCMQHQEVFLCLDNVWPKDIEEAKMYLQLNYKVGSKVLVTSRSHEVLKSLGFEECHCMEMPELDKRDSTELFLHYVGLVSTNNINEQEWDVINGCVEACHFSKRSSSGLRSDSSNQQYLPLALKVWGTQLGQISRCPLEWRRSLENLCIHKFNHFNDDSHPLFSLLRQGYDSLKPRDQLVFLDLALFVIGATEAIKWWNLKFDLMRWLQHAHGCDIFSIMQSLEALKRKVLLDFAMIGTELEFGIHDLYLEFAEEEVQALESSNQASCFLYDLGVCLPPKLRREWECRDLKRMGIYESEVKSIKREDLFHCSKVDVLQVYECSNLEELDVEGMDGLRILDVVGCEKLGEKFRGVNKLKDLEWLRLDISINQVSLGDLSSLTALQFLELKYRCIDILHPPNLGGCRKLRELIIFGFYRSLPNLGNLTMLEKVCVCSPLLQSVIGSNSLTNLKVLNLCACYSMVELRGLCDLVALETLDVSLTRLSELHGIGKLQHLQELDVSFCENLTSLVELEHVTSLCRLRACLCTSLKELPSMINLKRLEEVYLFESGISMIHGGFGRLARKRICNLGGCVEFLEPLVLWLWEQELLSMEGLNGSIFPGLSCIEESEAELRSCIRKDVAYYMNQITSLATRDHRLASKHNSLGEKEGGIEYAIKALCEHEDLGILSLVVAKYSTEVILKTTIPRLSSHIIDFLHQQLNYSSSERNIHPDLAHPTFARILFILEHVLKNAMLVKSLEADNIYLFILKFGMNDDYSNERYEFGERLDPVLKQWSTCLKRCCFYEACTCMESLPKEE